MRWRVLGAITHDPDAFTQGLVFHEGALFESAGRYGRSSLRRLDPDTGEVAKLVRLPPEMFAEGLAALPGRLVQLTWKAGRALFWDPVEFKPLGEARYAGQGWGLARFNGHLVMSDGTCELFFRRADDFSLVRQVTVRVAEGCVADLNELETVRGFVWCNVWHSDEVVVADPESGKVLARADFSALRRRLPGPGGALNGLAWDHKAGVLYATGKNWPRMFKLRIESAPGFSP